MNDKMKSSYICTPILKWFRTLLVVIRSIECAPICLSLAWLSYKVLDEWDFARFQLKMSFERKCYIAQPPATVLLPKLQVLDQ